MVTALTAPATAQQIPADLYEAMLAERADGERLLWCGQPSARRVRQLNSGYLWIWAPQILISLWHIYTSSHLPVYIRFIYLTLLSLQCLAFSYPFWAANRARRTAYAITNRRLLTASHGAKGKILVNGYKPLEFENAQCVELPDGTGDLFFARPLYLPSVGGYGPSANGRFNGIPNVREVERLLRDTYNPGSRSAG